MSHEQIGTLNDVETEVVDPMDGVLEETVEPEVVLTEEQALVQLVPGSMRKQLQHMDGPTKMAFIKEHFRSKGQVWKWNGKSGELVSMTNGAKKMVERSGNGGPVPIASVLAEITTRLQQLELDHPEKRDDVTALFLELDQAVNQAATKNGELITQAVSTLRGKLEKGVRKITEVQKGKKKGGKGNQRSYEIDDDVSYKY